MIGELCEEKYFLKHYAFRLSNTGAFQQTHREGAMKKVYIFVALLIVGLLASAAVQALERHSLWQTAQELRSRKLVDLTHAFCPGIPHWGGFPDEKRDVLFTYEKDGFCAERYSHIGQWGTHCDPPVHFHKGMKTIDAIPLKEMILPLAVIDVHQEVTKNPDFILTLKDLKEWERRNGTIPEGAFVAMRTDWSRRWPDASAMSNHDGKGVAHYPGWSVEVLKYLYEDRKITASGHETTDTDPGIITSKDSYPAESYLLSTNHYQIELLANLDQLPETGAMVICTFPKPKNGTGFPARVFAILP